MDYHEWTNSLHVLRKKTGFDFAGMASVIRGRRTLLVWRTASGNRNSNYLKIVLEPGKGVAGGVFRREKAMVVQDTPLEYNESEIVHSPILLAEDLRSFAAFPLWADRQVEAVLLLAMRRGNMVTKKLYKEVLSLLADGFCGLDVHQDPYEATLEENEQEYKALPIYELVDVPVRAALREERRRIARDLHDSVIQNLVGVQMQLRTLKYTDQMEEIREGLRVADESLSRIQNELREILDNVKPGIVEDLGLQAAFRQHFRFLENTHQNRVIFADNIGGQRFGTDIETVVYRICQEAAANACKYAETDIVEVDLLLQKTEAGERFLHLEVRDQGKGFDTENLQIRGGGMGLPGMQYWASIIGAKLTVRSAPEKGTCVTLHVPLDEETNRQESGHTIISGTPGNKVNVGEIL